MLPLSEKTQRIAATGPLNEWSEEEVIQWEEWYANHLDMPEVVQ
jgi:hypothetical protein